MFLGMSVRSTFGQSSLSTWFWTLGVLICGGIGVVIVHSWMFARLDFYYMPFCPYGKEALAKVISLAEGGGKRFRLRVFCIARDREVRPTGADPAGFPESVGSCSGDSAGDAEQKGRFVSLHGVAEIEEGKRQALIARHWPDRLIPYLKRFLRDTRHDWKADCIVTGIPADELARRMASPEADECYARNISESRRRGVHLSPTLNVNGREVRSLRKDLVAFRRELCAIGAISKGCEGIRCRSSTECPPRPGYRVACRRGFCLYQRESPPGDSPECLVITPRDAEACRQVPFEERLSPWLGRLRIRRLDLESEQAQEILKTTSIQEFPVLAFPSDIEKTDWGRDLITKLNAKSQGNYYVVSVSWTAMPFQVYGCVHHDADGVRAEINPFASALVLHELGCERAAAVSYWQSLAHHPQEPPYWNNLGAILYDRQNLHQTAAVLFRRALSIKPDYDPALRNMIRYHVERNELEKAAVYKERLGWALCGKQRWQEAAAVLGDIVAFPSVEYSARKGVAWATVKLGQPGQALPHLLKCVKIRKPVEPR